MKEGSFPFLSGPPPVLLSGQWIPQMKYHPRVMLGLEVGHCPLGEGRRPELDGSYVTGSRS